MAGSWNGIEFQILKGKMSLAIKSPLPVLTNLI